MHIRVGPIAWFRRRPDRIIGPKGSVHVGSHAAGHTVLNAQPDHTTARV